MLGILLNVALVSGSVVVQESSAREESQTTPAKGHIKNWMDFEKKFEMLDMQLAKILGEDFSHFRQYMNERIQEHHAKGKDCLKGPFAEQKAKQTTYDDCSGKGSLTESEFILHQALDRFTKEYPDKKAIQKVHEEAHAVFAGTRAMLYDMSLLQSSEFDPQVLEKREKMAELYKRSEPQYE